MCQCTIKLLVFKITVTVNKTVIWNSNIPPSPHGYVPWKYSTGIWRHTTKIFVSTLMILVPNNFPIPALILSWTLLKNITKCPWTLKLRNTIDWPLTGITSSNMLTFPCQLTSPKPSEVFSALPKIKQAMQSTNI